MSLFLLVSRPCNYHSWTIQMHQAIHTCCLLTPLDFICFNFSSSRVLALDLLCLSGPSAGEIGPIGDLLSPVRLVAIAPIHSVAPTHLSSSCAVRKQVAACAPGGLPVCGSSGGLDRVSDVTFRSNLPFNSSRARRLQVERPTTERREKRKENRRRQRVGACGFGHVLVHL